MITTRLGLVKDSALEKGVLAQTAAIGADADRRFILGMCYEDGTPLGVLVNHTASTVRRWQRVDHVLAAAEKMLGRSMSSFTVAISDATNNQLFQFFWETYRIGERTHAPNDPLEQDRLSIVEATENARSPSTADT